ncbi:acetyl-CoA C-acyltransferase [Microbulbifer thermotolerans]|uniref:acetyl-CoA C-acyltransferase n=1 Tax=Microbulbifer thermotolerans TaxID=252514 RepID=UPI00224AF98B|nr:acetyl-CoA C-acyltransferase [Microbulbifer thermotolerans]MCX2783079.1 acetyl-CoA C-acyltransferase [Microbulbifer thermotolerans]
MSDVTSDPVVIVGMARTPMGAMQGGLSEVSAPELGSVAIRAALEDAGMAPADVDEVLMGCVLPAGVGQAPARQASIRAGVPEGTPCTTVNKVCGSGMKTVMMARDALLLGEGRVIVAGGMESMTNAPYLLPKARGGMRLGHGEVKDHMFLDGLENAYDGKLMGNFAENTADKYGFTREEQDAFALESLARAQKAIESGAFEREIAPVTISTRRGDVQVRVDEGPGNARPDKIPQLKPAFRKDGTVTAANASSISDGAAALVLMRRSEAERRGLKVLAILRGQAQFAHQPEWFTTAPVGAMQKLLERTGWSVDEVDLFEINEAFAVVAMAAMRELNLPHDKVNVNGGACALGHPLGASGARILVTLLAAMEKRDVKRGIASLCIGGGEATAVAIERA